MVSEDGSEKYDRPETYRGLVTWVYDGESFTPVAKVTEKDCYTIVHDYLGTPTQAYDSAGTLVWEMLLDVYGEVMESRGDRSLVPFRYQGQYEDVETGLYYNRFRYYSPEMGMYISSDPIGLSGNNPTLYGYVQDVNTWLDVWGLSDCKITQRLNELANEAVKEAKLSKRQTASIQRSIDRASASTDPKVKAYHEMMAAKKEKMYMGTQIDTLFKKKVEADKMLREAGIQTTPRGKFGPDVYTKDEYWDLTTETDWHKGTHQTKYDSEYGDGTGIFW